jgi:AcrR family transcriptional regulator
MAGDVDKRIMDAATRVFLAHGLEGATIDKIARAAGASKPTIYGRYPGKEALFAAVVENEISRVLLHADVEYESDSVRERLEHFALIMLTTSLERRVVALLRIIIAEAPRFPALARAADESARRKGSIVVARILKEAAENGELPALRGTSRHALLQTAEFYLNLAFLPLEMRALVGEDIKTLKAQSAQHVSFATRFFLKGCGLPD